MSGRARSKTTKPALDVANALVKKQIAALSQLADFRTRLAGMQFGGKRDVYQVAGYPAILKFEDFWAMYSRDGIAGRIVDMPSRTTWRTPPEIVELDMPDAGTDFTNGFTKLAKRTKLWGYFSRVDRLAGVGRYAVLLIGTGASDQELSRELTNLPSIDDILYLSVYHEKNALIEEWETDPSNERFGLPRLYRLKTTTDSQVFKTRATDLIVHASRLIHVAEDKLEDDVFGRPRLERVINRLYDLEKVAASTGESYWQLVTQILQAKIDKEVDISADQLKEMDEKLGEMVHDLRRTFYGRGIELSYLPTQTPNVQQVADFYFSLIAGAAGIPKRILFGSEMGELASSQDQENYYGTINERQEQFVEPEIVRPFIDRLVAWGALPTPTKNDGDYQVNWKPLYEESDDQKAGADLKRAQIAQTLTPVGGNPREMVTVDADGRVALVERQADEPIDMLLPLDTTHPNNQEPPPPIIMPPGQPGDPNTPPGLPGDNNPNAPPVKKPAPGDSNA